MWRSVFRMYGAVCRLLGRDLAVFVAVLNHCPRWKILHGKRLSSAIPSSCGRSVGAEPFLGTRGKPTVSCVSLSWSENAE